MSHEAMTYITSRLTSGAEGTMLNVNWNGNGQRGRFTSYSPSAKLLTIATSLGNPAHIATDAIVSIWFDKPTE